MIEKLKAWTKRASQRVLLAHPPTGLSLAAALGRRLGTVPGLKATPSRDEITRLFGERPPSEVARILREMGAHERQNQALFVLLGNRGIEPMLPLIRVHGGDRLLRMQRDGEPAILVLWHVGVPFGPLAGCIELGVPSISLGENYPFPPGYELPGAVRYYVGEERRLAFLKEALEQLRRGGVVVLALDGFMGSAFADVPFLGHAVPVGRGAATLARRSGAPLMPVVARWAGRGGRIDCTFYEPLPIPDVAPEARADYERALLASATEWFGRYTLAHPEDLRRRWVWRYLEFPAAPAEPGGAAPLPTTPPRSPSP